MCVWGGIERMREDSAGQEWGEGGGPCYHTDKREGWTERMREDSRG